MCVYLISFEHPFYSIICCYAFMYLMEFPFSAQTPREISTPNTMWSLMGKVILEINITFDNPSRTTTTTTRI